MLKLEEGADTVVERHKIQKMTDEQLMAKLLGEVRANSANNAGVTTIRIGS